MQQTRIVTADVIALARFYEQVTSLEADGSEDYIEFRGPGNKLAICSERAMRMHWAGVGRARDNQSVILDFEVDDVDAERGRLAPVVGRFVLEPTTQPWGTRVAMFRDPDGNLVNLITARDGTD